MRGLLLIFAIILAVGLAYSVAVEFVDARGKALISLQERNAAKDELDLFSIVDRAEGRHGLILEVSQQAELNGRTSVFALKDANGALIAGNLKAWPASLENNAFWLARRNVEGRSELRISTRRLSDGMVVLVGHDNQALESFQDTVIGSVWVAIAIVAVTCILIAMAITSLIMARVRELSATAQKVSSGDFQARARDRRGHGPFDQIARAQNMMLARIEDLITGLRIVTDSLAHDLRTPLAQTRKYIEDGVLSGGLQDKQNALEAALTEVDRTISTFSSLIDIARAEGGLSRNAMEAVALSPLAQGVYDLFQPLAEERAIHFNLQVTAVHIHGHRTLLMQAVSNLVHNAIKYAPDGGQVDLEISAYGDGAQILVADNGPGIAPEERDDAVRRFTQVGVDTRPKGLGLGLAIVEAAARLHNGKLILEDNAPGLRACIILAGH
ncbi:hypothetical protein AEAC466_17955 [Asticcacaulis sp. AC466]|nr:hypothetical protein AEAC466_17955 [Asticcacaulis sp. AC466]